MFVIGTCETKVVNNKVEMPKEYKLRKAKRVIYGLWQGERKLFLSDEITPLKQKTDKEGMIFEVGVDITNKIKVPTVLNGSKVVITGCIGYIEIDFR